MCIINSDTRAQSDARRMHKLYSEYNYDYYSAGETYNILNTINPGLEKRSKKEFLICSPRPD